MKSAWLAFVLSLPLALLVTWLISKRQWQEHSEKRDSPAPQIALEPFATDLPPNKDQPAPESAPDAILDTEGHTFSNQDLALIHRLQGLFNTGNYIGALETVDGLNLEDLTPETASWVEDQMLVLLTAAAWSHLRLGRCHQAIPIFWRADAEQRTKEIIKGLAYCLRRVGNLYDAEELLGWNRKYGERDYHIDLLHSDVLESLGEYGTALEVLLDIEAETEDETKEVEKRVAQMKGREKESQKQHSIRSQHFDLRYRAYDHGGLAEFSLKVLDDAVEEFVEIYGFSPPSTTIEVVLYPDDGFQSLVLDSPEWAAGVFDGRLRIPIRRGWEDQVAPPRLAQTLRHELVHALFAQMTDFRSLPPWFDEGVAQLAACSGDRCQNFSFQASPARFLDLIDFTKSFATYTRVKAKAAYRQSLYLILNILRISEIDSPLREIVSRITTDSPLDSTSILAPSEISFAHLVRTARKNWKKRITAFP